MPEFTVRKAFDGVYYVTAAAQDLAGNRSREQRLRFSVNRFGSSYEAGDIAYGGGNAYGSGGRDYGDDSRASGNTFSSSISSIGISNSPTMTYIRRYFNRETKDPLVIREINPSPVEEYSVTMRKDSVQRVLQPGRDYKRTVELDEEGKHSYLYEIACPVFEKEGNYSFVIRSRDSAGNENSTAQVMQEEAAEEMNWRSVFSLRMPRPVWSRWNCGSGRVRLRRAQMLLRKRSSNTGITVKKKRRIRSTLTSVCIQEKKGSRFQYIWTAPTSGRSWRSSRRIRQETKAGITGRPGPDRWTEKRSARRTADAGF